MLKRDYIYKARVIDFGRERKDDGTFDPKVELFGQWGYIKHSNDKRTRKTSNLIRRCLKAGDFATVKYLGKKEGDALSFIADAQFKKLSVRI